MCGITGIIHDFINIEEAKSKISKMVNIIGHRGPDALCAVIGKKFCAATARLSIEKIKEGDGTLRKYTIEIDRLRGTLNFKMHKAHGIDMPAEVSLNEYQGWNEARKCQKNKKLF